MATNDKSLTPQEQAKLKAFAQGLPDNPGDIDVDAIAQETGTSRRQVLQVIAAVGVGSIAGGVSVSQLVSEAQAQASTSDGDGNVGTPADRVDVFADGVDASVIDTEVLDTGPLDGDYVIREEGGTVTGTGPTGEIDSGSDFATVAGNVFSNIPSRSNRDHTVQIVMKTDSRVDVGSTLQPPGKSVVDWHGSYKLAHDGDMLEVTEDETRIQGNPDLFGDITNRSSGAAVHLSGGKRHWVDGLFMREFPGDGVLIDGSAQEYWVEDCDIGACGGRGVDARNADGWIEDNDIGNCTVGIYTRGGNINIESNAVFLCEGAGISAFGQYIAVVGNRSKENDVQGFELGPDEGTVVGNIAKNNGQDSNADTKNRVGYFVKGSGSSWQANVANDDQSTATQVHGATFVTDGENVFDGFVVQNSASSAYNFSPSSSDKTGTNNPTI